MRSEGNTQIEFIRRHCGSVAIEAPSGRATGAQRQGLIPQSPVHLERNGAVFRSYHPAGEAIPPGTRLLRINQLIRRKCYVN